MMSRAEHETLTQDVVFDLLSNQRRRYVLYYLKEIDDSIQLQDLADQVSAWENEMPIDELSYQQRKRVYVSLYQTHIPKLEEAGLIEYDSDTGMVSITTRHDELGGFLPTEESSPPWQLYYIVLAAVSLLFFALVSFDVAVFEAIPELFAGLMITGAVVVLALVHYAYRRRSSWDPTALVTNNR